MTPSHSFVILYFPDSVDILRMRVQELLIVGQRSIVKTEPEQENAGLERESDIFITHLQC